MASPSRSVTMKDVADACGVSVVTVSRVLRGSSRHAAATCTKIRQMAEAMGYCPNPLVAALMSERGRHKPGKGTVNLGIINLGGEGWKLHPFYHGIVKQAEFCGFSIEMFRLEPGLDAARKLRRVLQNRGVRGVIVLPAPGPDWRLDFNFDGFATATIGYSVAEPALPRVVTDTYMRVTEALQQVESRGYRRIGLLGTHDLDSRFRHQVTASIEVYRKVGKPRGEVFYKEVPEQFGEKDRHTLLNWIRRNRLDVVISQLDSRYEFLCDAGIRIPQKLGFVFLHRHANPRVTCLDQMQEWIGTKATDVVVAMINRNEFKVPPHSQTVMIPSVWHEGETCPAKVK